MANRNQGSHSHRTKFEYHVDPPESGAEAASVEVISGLTDRYRASVRTHTRQALRIDEALAKKRAELGRLISDRHQRRFSNFSRKQRASSYGLKDFRPRHFNADALHDAQKAAHKTSETMLRRAKIDAEALERVHDVAAGRLRRITRPTLGRAARLDLVPVEEVPIQSLGGSTDGWFVKTPPYDGTYTWWNYNKWGGSLQHHHNVEVLENPFTYITGQFGHYSRYENYDASDWDALFLTDRSGVGFWFTPQQAGNREIWVKIRVKFSRADVWVDNEWGWSYAWQDFFTRFELSVQQLQGVQGLTNDWHVYVKGDPDSKWYHMPMLANNSEIWIPFTVNFPPDSVFIWVGCEDHRQSGIDDMSVDATMKTEYVLEEVHIPL